MDPKHIVIAQDSQQPGWVLLDEMRDLDTYRIGRVWYTIWHKEQQPHGQQVDEFQQVGRGGMQVGQPVIVETPHGEPLGTGRVKAIRILDPALAAREGLPLEVANFQTAGHGSTRCWYIMFEPVDDRHHIA